MFFANLKYNHFDAHALPYFLVLLIDVFNFPSFCDSTTLPHFKDLVAWRYKTSVTAN